MDPGVRRDDAETFVSAQHTSRVVGFIFHTMSFDSYSFAISLRVAREFCQEHSALSSQRAQGMPGARCAR
jgi:hypothetical protein